jgi:hypothetical protein
MCPFMTFAVLLAAILFAVIFDVRRCSQARRDEVLEELFLHLYELSDVW